MDLSAAFLVEQLQKSYKISVTYELSTTPHLIHPIIYIPEMHLKDYMVYIVNKTDLDTLENFGKLPKNCLFIIMNEKTNHKIPNACSLYGSNNPLTVFLEIQELFEFYGVWKKNLMHAYFTDKHLQTMLSMSISVLKNSLFIIGMDFTILAAVYLDPTRYYENVLGSSKDTHARVTALKNSKLYSEVKKLDGAFYFPSNVTGVASLCVNIKQNNKTTHRLVMQEDNRRIEKNEGFLLEFLASLIQDMINPSLADNYNQINQANQINHINENLTKLFIDILSYKNIDNKDISRKLNAEGWLSNHKYACIYIKLTEMDVQNYSYNPLRHYLNNVLKNSCSILYKKSIVAFVNLTLSQVNLDGLIKRVNEFSRESLLKLGISPIKAGHSHLRYQYSQAQIALTIGSQNSPEKQVHLFSDIAFDYILQKLTTELPASMIIQEGLLDLIENDRINNTEYMETLRIYLNNKCNATQTAEKLFIHRSTLIYRLDKIKEILGSDLTDPDEFLYIMLSCRLLNYQ